MAEYAERSLNEDAGSAEAESSEEPETAESRNPDLFDFIREHEEAAKAEDSNEAVATEQ
jgi:hypothetical protein